MIAARDLPAAFAVTAAATFLGTSFVATRSVIAETEPGTLAFLRFALAVACLTPFAAAFRRQRVLARDIPAFAILGFLQYGIFQYFLNSGLQSIAASRGAVIFSLIPVLTMSIAVVMRFERLTLAKLAATVLSIIGVSLALGDKAFAEGAAAADWTGELLFFAGVCCGATYNVFAQRLLRTYAVLPFTILVMLSGVFTLALFAGYEGAFQALPRFTPTGWLAVAFLALPAGAISFYLFNWALKRLSATRTAIFVPISPMAAAFFGWLILDEPISALFVVGLACVVAGIWLANRPGAVARDLG